MHKLEHLDYEITKACNLSCVHCSANAGEGDPPNLELIYKTLISAKELGLKRVGITGGEPFLFPKELSNIIDFSFDKLGCKVHIHTNGQLENNISLIYERSEKIDEITLTLLGYEYMHDKNCGGSYKKLKSFARNLLNHSIPLVIFLVPMSNNYKELSKAIVDFYNIGARIFRVMRLSPGGRAKENYQSLILNDEQSKEFLYQLECLEKELSIQFNAGFCTRLIYPKLKSLEHHNCCTSGINRLHISANGYVFPCTAASGFINVNIGNMNKQDLKNIWQESDILNTLRKDCPSKLCKVQEHFKSN